MSLCCFLPAYLITALQPMSVARSLQFSLLIWSVLLQGGAYRGPQQPDRLPAQLLSITRASPSRLGGKENFGGPQWKSLMREGQQGRHKRFVYEGFTRQCPRDNTSGDGLPHSAIGWLANGCTAVLVGPRQLLTAGHCVYGRRGWQTKGLDFYRHMRCGSLGELVQWERAYVLEDWARYRLQGADLGLVVLTEGYNATDYLGFGYNETWSTDTPVTSVGYANDQFGSYYCQCSTACTADECMAYDSNSALVYLVFGWRGAHRLCHRCATTSTTSGSPLLVSDGQFNTTEEGQGDNPDIYIGGVISGSALSSNTAVKITKSRFDAIRYVKCASGVAASCEEAGQ